MHFSQQLGLACCIAQAGTGLGQTVMAPIVSRILESHSLAVVLYFFAATFSISLSSKLSTERSQKIKEMKLRRIRNQKTGEGIMRSV